jgi:hypothetical protein
MKVADVSFENYFDSVGKASAGEDCGYPDEEMVNTIQQLNDEIYHSIRSNELKEIDSINMAKRFVCTR